MSINKSHYCQYDIICDFWGNIWSGLTAGLQDSEANVSSILEI